MPANRFNCQQTLIRVIVLFALWLQFYRPAAGRCSPLPNRQPVAAVPDLQVEFLGSEKGFAIDGQSVAVLLRHSKHGHCSAPENAARVRCYPLTGLDFMDGHYGPTCPTEPKSGGGVSMATGRFGPVYTTVFSVLISKADSPLPNPTVAGPEGRNWSPRPEKSRYYLA